MWFNGQKCNSMSKEYIPTVIHYSTSQSQQHTRNCRFVSSLSYIEDHQDIAWFNNRQYAEIFKIKRSLDHPNKLIAVVRLRYKSRIIRRRYMCDQTLSLSDDRVGLTSESIRILFDDKTDPSQKFITISKGNIWDVFMYYWNHPFHATRISFKVGFISILVGILSLVISVISIHF